MIARILAAKHEGDTCGGIFEVVAFGVPVGLGSHSQWDRRLSARLGMAMMSIPSPTGVEIGAGFAATRETGSHIHDVLRHGEARRSHHMTYTADGSAAAITNAAPLV